MRWLSLPAGVASMCPAPGRVAHLLAQPIGDDGIIHPVTRDLGQVMEASDEGRVQHAARARLPRTSPRGSLRVLRAAAPRYPGTASHTARASWPTNNWATYKKGRHQQMSANDKPGTLGHVRGMAAAVYLYESERGNVYPRLDLSIDYRDPKHIRLRTYDQDHKVVDTLGANDLAEASLLAGLTIRASETQHAKRMRANGPKPDTRRRPPVALRFLDAVTLQLKRQKQAGAAEDVHRAASLQFHPDHWSEETEARRVLALAEWALRSWAVRGLSELGGVNEVAAVSTLTSYLDPTPTPFRAVDAADAASTLEETAAWLADPDEQAGPKALTRNGVARVLHEVVPALRCVAEGGAVDPVGAIGLPGDPLARSVEHAGKALAVAFRVGLITQLPPAFTATLAWLDRIG
jgi:hypothetical protein